MKNEVKQKLVLNKVTIQNLNVNQDTVLKKEELRNARGGSVKLPVGTTEHPRYC